MRRTYAQEQKKAPSLYGYCNLPTPKEGAWVPVGGCGEGWLVPGDCVVGG